LKPLTQKSLALAARELAARDQLLAGIHAKYGDPPLWRRATGFSTLAHIILEQQVSLKSAKAMLVRLEASIQPFTPLRFLELGETYLRSLGVTRQKSAYLLDLSESIVSGELSFTRLARMSVSECSFESGNSRHNHSAITKPRAASPRYSSRSLLASPTLRCVSASLSRSASAKQ